MRSKRSTNARVARIFVGVALVGATVATAAPAHAAGSTISVGDATVVEGNSGPKGRTVIIPVSLTQPGTGSSVTVDYAVVGTGSATAGSDYVPKSGTLTFKLGASGKTTVQNQVVVPIIGDTALEGDETFEVHLSNPQGGGGFSLARAIGTVTIRDDDPNSGVSMSIGDVTTVEGDLGFRMRAVRFMVTLSAPSPVDVTVQWMVVGDTALCARTIYGNPTQPGQDCASSPTPKTLRFRAGRSGLTGVSTSVAVALFPDTEAEGDQTFHITLSGITGATLADDTGVGTILDDD